MGRLSFLQSLQIIDREASYSVFSVPSQKGLCLGAKWGGTLKIAHQNLQLRAVGSRRLTAHFWRFVWINKEMQDERTA